MGELISLGEYRNKKRERQQNKNVSSTALSKPPGKKALPRIKLPPLGEVFVKNLHLRVSDPYALDQFILDLFAEPDLPKLDPDNEGAALNTDYQLQIIAKSQTTNFPFALYNARLHMERFMGFSMHRLAVVRANPNYDRIARGLLGMYSIAWQLETGQELVVDSKSMASRYGKK